MGKTKLYECNLTWLSSSPFEAERSPLFACEAPIYSPLHIDINSFPHLGSPLLSPPFHARLGNYHGAVTGRHTKLHYPLEYFYDIL